MPNSSALMSLLKKLLVSLLRILVGVPIVSLIVYGMLFLVFSVTVRGRCVGLSEMLIGSVLFCSVGYWNRPWFKRGRGLFFKVFLPAGVLLYLVPMSLAPSGGTVDGRVRNCFLEGQGQFSRFSPWNVIPEVDQLHVGMSFLPLGDPYVDFAQAKRMRSLMLPIYGAMDQDNDFHELGSVMRLAYREVLRMEYRAGHYYLFLPEVAAGEKLPCVVFLHGMGGNTKSYLWVLSRMSAKMKCAVIAPTFGLGYWDKEGGAELVVNVTRETLATLPVDPNRVFLLGYSNGAMGVTRAAIRQPGLFAGLIYLSPITEDELFSTQRFLTRTGDRKILFLHGGRDRRIPRRFVEGTVASLERLGCDARLKVYDDEDHFLFLSQQESVLGDLIECMAED